jgi:adenosylcobinamide hydrolase
MRYYLRGNTLFIRGSFRAASSGTEGGISSVETLLYHTTNPDFQGQIEEQIIRNEIAREGLPKARFGLLSPIDLRHLCILNYDFITAFIAAGSTNNAHSNEGYASIIICSTEGMADQALIGGIITATEAKIMALESAVKDFPDTTINDVIVAGEGEPVHRSAMPSTDLGERIREAVRFGTAESVKRSSGTVQRNAPSFFVLSRYGGKHWVEWRPEQCPYYPCHFEGQRCDFCYCPFYPCGDETLGCRVKSSLQPGFVWNCAGCTLLHEPEIADYLKKYPEASLRELKSLKKKSAKVGE